MKDKYILIIYKKRGIVKKNSLNFPKKKLPPKDVLYLGDKYMLVYEKIARLQMNDSGFSLRTVFGKEKLKYLEQGRIMMLDQGYEMGIEPLNHMNLKQFYVIYQSYISQKKNAKVADLIANYTSRIDAGEKIYLGYVKKKSRLVGGGIFVDKINHERKCLVLGFRAFEPEVINKLSLGYYIEYLYFLFGIELGVEAFSRGSDRNCYGMIGSSVGLPIHKVQLHFTPYLSAVNKNKIEIDPATIHQETIILTQENESLDWFDTINVRTSLSHDDAEKQYGIFKKRGFNINYFYLP